MTKFLSKLLSIDERNFESYIKRLENICLNPGIDIRLSTEIKQKSAAKILVLGFKPEDTTIKETFYMLVSKLKHDDQKLQEKLKISEKSPDATSKVLIKTASKLVKDERVLCLTSSGAKRVLTAVPPRKTLKALSLRSIDSVLKREDAKAVFAIADQIEDDSWHSQVLAKIKRLPVKDIQWQSAQVYLLNSQWTEKLLKKFPTKGFQFSSIKVGSVILLPVIKKYSVGIPTLVLGSLLHSAEVMSAESAQFRYKALYKGFQNVFIEMLAMENIELEPIHGLTPSWRAVHELSATGYVNIETAELEIELNEVKWKPTETKLASLVPSMSYWVGSHYIGTTDGIQVVSYHLLDVAMAVALNKNFGDHPTNHLEGSLWNELQIRYLKHDTLNRALMKQLNINEFNMVL